jgi:hypothetical protein
MRNGHVVLDGASKSENIRVSAGSVLREGLIAVGLDDAEPLRERTGRARLSDRSSPLVSRHVRNTDAGPIGSHRAAGETSMPRSRTNLRIDGETSSPNSTAPTKPPITHPTVTGRVET